MPPVAAAAIGPAISAGGGILGGIFGKKAAKKAEAARQLAYKEAGDTVRTNTGLANDQYTNWLNNTGEDLSPYQNAGLYGLSGLTDPEQVRNFGVEDFQVDPGYQFALEQGQRGIENSAAAGGRLLSGASLKALNRFNIGQANQQYQNSFDRFNQNRAYRGQLYGGLAGMGQNAANTLGTFGGDAAGGMSNNYMNSGLNLAQLRLGQGLSAANTISQRGNLTQGMIGNTFSSLGQFGKNLGMQGS